MSSHEPFPPDLSHLAFQAVDECKKAAASLQEPSVMWSNFEPDSLVMYQALPLHQEREPVDVTRLNEVSIGVYHQLFGSWTIIRGESNIPEQSVEFTQYTVENFVLGGIRRAIYNTAEDDQRENPENNKAHFLQFIDGLREAAERGVSEDEVKPTTKDIDHLRVALSFLSMHNEIWFEEYMERRRAMTKHDRRAERATQFALTYSETDKTKLVQYWTIDTCMGLVYAAKADDPAMAAAIVDEHLKETSGYGLMFFSHTPIEGDEADKFEMILSDETEVVRLIPMSTEPWPKDIDNLTVAQRLAMDRLK